jgi:ubiquinone/menaquinone biosynthesis C-methylase UbiE
MDMANAFQSSCVLFAACDLGLFGFLEPHDGAGAADVAAGLGLDPRGARLLLDACVALGLLRRGEGGRYTNVPEAAAFLVPGKPGDLTQALRYNRDVYPAWGRLAEMSRTGRPAERPETHLGEDPERTRRFVMAMHARAMAIGRAVVPLLGFTGGPAVLDVGGGSGAYSLLIAESLPDARCTVLDLPAVSAVARELVDGRGMSHRVRCVAGDYRRDAFPGGQDAVLLFGMLHQESPDSIRALLAKSFAALRPGGRVCVLDLMTDATRARPVFSALFALNMALTTENGWVFSDADLLGWLAEAGFREAGVQPLPPPMPHWLATARKPR